jgi:hypothetical protein
MRDGTFANDCFAGRDTPDRPEPVSADLWLDSQNVATGARIWEQSKALPSYASVLTLLWIKERIEIYSDSDNEASLDDLDPDQFRISRRKWPLVTCRRTKSYPEPVLFRPFGMWSSCRG